MSKTWTATLAVGAALLCAVPSCLSAPSLSLRAPQIQSNDVDGEEITIKGVRVSLGKKPDLAIVSDCGDTEEVEDSTIVALNSHESSDPQIPLAIVENEDVRSQPFVEASHTCHPTHWRWSYLTRPSCMAAAAQIPSTPSGGFAFTGSHPLADNLPVDTPHRLFSTTHGICEIIISYVPGREQQRLENRYSWNLIKEAAVAQIDGCRPPSRWLGAAGLVGSGRAVLSNGIEQGEVWVDVVRRTNDDGTSGERESRDFL